MLQLIIRSFVITLSLAVVLCGVYPLAVTVVAKIIFPHQAAGSLIVRDGKVLGSKLIAQDFKNPNYFHPRLSAVNYAQDAAASGATNFGPTSPALASALKKRAADLITSESGLESGHIPADLITTSGSGLDPHISPEAAFVQIPRIAKTRVLSQEKIKAIIRKQIEKPSLWILGRPRVNVLVLNLELDEKSNNR